MLKKKYFIFHNISPYLFIFCPGLNQTVQPGGNEKKLIKNAWNIWQRPGLLYYLWCFWLKDGSTALFKAAHKGHCNVIEELLKFSPSLGLLKVRQHHLMSKTSRKWFSCDWVCVLSCNLERFYSSSCRRHGRESKNCWTSAEGKCWSSFTQQGDFEICGL